MMWKEYIDNLKSEFIGKRVLYNGRAYNIVEVDYNGVIHIDLPGKHNPTTAVYTEFEARKAVIE